MKTLHLHRVPFFLSILSAALLVPRSLAADLFVDASLTTGANDGSSWSDAFQGNGGVTEALAAAAAGDRVFVAQGTYLPSLTGAQDASFVLRHGVEIFGGFLGGEASPDERPPFGSALTVLSGDLNGDDPTNILENSFHVLRVTGNALPVLDGFKVTGGNAQLGGSLSARGGGMLCDTGGRPVIRNCEFHGNVAAFDGGACYIVSSATPTFVACSFVDNIASNSGGAVHRGVRGGGCSL